MAKYDFSGWATKNDLLCSDGRTIRRDAFKQNDGETVPLVWNHGHNDPENILGHALLENREEGVYAYCTFNESESGVAAKEAVRHGDVKSLSIYANKLKQSGHDVLHGMIREVSIVMAGANPGAFIDSVMMHGEDTEEGFIINYDEANIMMHHYEEAPEVETEEVISEEETIEHADTTKKEEPKMAEVKEEKKVEPEVKEDQKTVKDVFETLTEEQKTVVYALIGQAIEDAKAEKDDEKEDMKHSEGGNEMYNNVFDREEIEEMNVITHADQMDIMKEAQAKGSFKRALESWGSDHLEHGFATSGDDAIGRLFPDYKNLEDGAPGKIEFDYNWVDAVMGKARKNPASRVRTRQVDVRVKELQAKGYNSRADQKALAGNVKLIMRTTDPQTVYYRDNLHRDDVIDMDFDVIAYQNQIMERSLKETIALAALVGDGLEDNDADKISEDHIRPVWKDADIYTIKAPIDLAAVTAELQGSNTSANFGKDFIFTEAVITAALHAREQYKGKGVLDFYCAPSTVNQMLLARDLNGRRIYESKADVARALNVGNIYEVEQFADLEARENEDGDQFELLGLFVNMNNYTFGSTKGGEITSFDDFDIDFNNYKFLLETRLSGALAEAYSAIALEKPVVAEPAAPVTQG